MSFHVISAAFYGIKWFHVINDLPYPTLNNWVKSLFEAGKRLNSVPVKKKDTINSEMLNRPMRYVQKYRRCYARGWEGGGGGRCHSQCKGIRGCAAGMGYVFMFLRLLVFIRVINSRF